MAAWRLPNSSHDILYKNILVRTVTTILQKYSLEESIRGVTSPSGHSDKSSVTYHQVYGLLVQSLYLLKDPLVSQFHTKSRMLEHLSM